MFSVTETKPSAWVRERFGDATEEFLHAIPLAMRRAHQQSVAAHIASELRTNDAYGNTLKVAQYEQLIACTAHIPGVVTRKPTEVTSRYDLVVFDETAVVLYPWRFAVDGRTRREDAKLPTPLSELRRSLLTLAPRNPEFQLSFDQIDEDPQDFADEQDLIDQISEFGRVVTIGYASNPSAMFSLGIGEVVLADEASGAVEWPHWEPLNTTLEALEQRPALTLAAPLTVGGNRFDDSPLDDLLLAPRTAVDTSVTDESAHHPKTGSDEG